MKMLSCRFACVVVGFLGLFGAPPVEALTFVRVVDDDLAAQAELIVEAEITAALPADGAAPGIDFTARILNVVHGAPERDEIVVRTPGGPGADGLWFKIHGVPRFQPGERVLLFLSADRDGVWRLLHVNQGAFFITELDGRDVAWRSFTGAEELRLVGRTLRPEVPRDLDRFVEWIRDPQPQKSTSYRLESIDLSALDAARSSIPHKFTVFRNNGVPMRWRQFDTGGSVTFSADSSGQPGMPGGGFGEFQAALQAWTNDPGTPIRLVYGGQTSASGGLTTFDGTNAVLFDDPNDNPDFDEPFDCSSGGVLAIGGPWFNPNDRHTFNGQTFIAIGGADIVTNKGIDCYVPFNNRMAQIMAHELGHTLALGHSCGDNPGDCDTAAKRDALMRATLQDDGRGASLRSDDRAGIAFLYAGTTGSAPDAPTGLQAVALTGAVELSWNDVATNESTYRVDRMLGAGNFSEIATLGAGSMFYRDESVATGTFYTYRVRAVNSFGAGISGSVGVTTLGPSAPTGLTATAVSSSSVRLDWNDTSTSEDGFEVQVGVPGGSFQSIGTVGANTEQATVIELLPSTLYEFRVRATSALGDSSFSNVASATTFAGEPSVCVPGPETACINGGRFKIEVDWLDFIGDRGPGSVVGVPPSVDADDSAVFWFFGSDNWELLVKVLDGCGVNDHFWVFAAATTNVEYTLRVTDTSSGFVRTYTNPLGVASPAVADVEAFATCAVPAAPAPDASSASTAASTARLAAPLLLAADDAADHGADDGSETATASVGPVAAVGELPTKMDCTPDTLGACLQDGRFRVAIDWRDFEGTDGVGRVVPFGSNDSGLFWFFGPNNWEVLIKVLDGCGVNNRFWVFSAATTNVEYTLTVTDTETGAFQEYFNPLGRLAPAITDTSAFVGCP
ncbi:MAG: fibronectin type III domain-containing protein [Acidobacteriota bacterium]